MDSKSGKRRCAQRSRKEVREILTRFEESGLTQAAFAQQQALNVGTLRNWIKRERKREAQESDFQEVHLLGGGKGGNGGADNVIVRLAGGSEVELPLSAGKAWVAGVVRELIKPW